MSEPASPQPETLDRNLFWLLRASCALCFAGWAWQHVYWDAPLGVLLWDPGVYDLMTRLGMDWDSFVGDGRTESFVRRTVVAAGWFLAACSVMALTVRRRSYLQMTALAAGGFLLAVVSYCKYLNALRQPAMLIEHGGQFLMPILLIVALRCGVRSRVTIGTAAAAFCMTFAGHGTYAIGWAPTPGHFYGMIMIITGAGEQLTETILRTAGVLDFVVCLAIFWRITRGPALLYATAWGLLTALARPVAGLNSSLIWWGADHFVHEAVLRTPHFLIPLFLFFAWRRYAATTAENPAPAATEIAEAARSDDATTPAPLPATITAS